MLALPLSLGGSVALVRLVRVDVAPDGRELGLGLLARLGLAARLGGAETCAQVHVEHDVPATGRERAHATTVKASGPLNEHQP